MRDDKPTVETQATFTTDGGIEAGDASRGTSLDEWGVDVDHQERESRVDEGASDAFADDRRLDDEADGGEQSRMMPEAVGDGQQSLAGGDAERPAEWDAEAVAKRARERVAVKKQPIPDAERRMEVEGGDRREIPDSGLSVSDITDWPYINDERENPAEREHFREVMRESHASDDEPAVATDGGVADSFDADEETVTDGWEGVFLYESWGYGQTNVDLARIVEVSDTGKTVLARMATPERVDVERGSERMRPTADLYGEEFRLHVREGYKGEPAFRGSYPYIDGEKESGTRKGSFGVFDNAEGKTLHQTPHGHKH